jgi:pyroglutamyl-peptidase
MSKVLVTGFEPFGSMSENSSWAVAERVAAYGIEGVVVECLPVSFARVGDALRKAVEEHRPDVIIMLGQAASSDCVRLERVALNMMDSKMGDNDGFVPDELPIRPGEENALFSTLPLKQLCETIRQQGIAVKVSNSCGLYVCNCLYYEALRMCKELEMQAIFVHLPMYDGQPSAKEGNPTLPLADMVQAVVTIIKAIF